MQLPPSLLVDGYSKTKEFYSKHFTNAIIPVLRENVHFKDVRCVKGEWGEYNKFIVLRAESCGDVFFAVQDIHRTYINAAEGREEQEIYEFTRKTLNEHRITQGAKPSTFKSRWLWLTVDTLPVYFESQGIPVPEKPVAKFRRLLMDDLFMGRWDEKVERPGVDHLTDMQLEWLGSRALWLVADGPEKAEERFNEMLAFSNGLRKNK